MSTRRRVRMLRREVRVAAVALALVACACRGPGARDGASCGARALRTACADLVIRRTMTTAFPPSATLLAGAAEVDITPHAGFSVAGYSTTAMKARGTCGHLWVRALFLSGEASERVALVSIDLQGASRYLLERAAKRTAASVGIGVDRLVIVGTHTHTGPAGYFGNSLYDTFAGNEAGFDRGLADWIAGRLARAVEEAAAAAVPARLGVATEPVWAASRNRSLGAFRKDPEAAAWNGAGMPGAWPPAGLSPEQRAIDPRVRVIAAFRDDTGLPIGAFALFACHGTTRGPRWPYYDPDWFGPAQRVARFEVEQAFPGSNPMVAVAGGASGDAHGLACEEPRRASADFDPADHVGAPVGCAIARAIRASAAGARSVAVRVRYSETSVADRTVGGDPSTELAPQWMFGAPTLAGSEEGRTPFHPLFAREGMRASGWLPNDHPQHPKAPAAGPLQAVLRSALGLAPCPVLPLHVVWLGDHVLGTVPGEPTAVAAWRIEGALSSLPGARGATVLGFAGDYGGYFATPEEFHAQHYEGSSTLFGRWASNHVQARLRALATAAPAPLAACATFRTGPSRARFVDGDDCGPVDPSPHASRCGPEIAVTWRMAARSRVAFSSGAWVRVEVDVGGSWVSLSLLGRPLDDRSAPILVEKLPSEGPSPLAPSAPMPGATEPWQARVRLPSDLVSVPLRVVVGARDRFPGFFIVVP